MRDFPTLEEQRKLASERVPVPLPEEVWTFAPWGHRILVRRQPPQERTPGGIIIPPSAREKLAVGWVVSVGPLVGVPRWDGKPSLPPGLTPRDLVGRKVVFSFYAGDTLHFGDVGYVSAPFESDFVVLQDCDIWGEDLS